ncbi:MAG: terminase family protein, partial [Candidatus Omnitrophica bacterium]|nr:terminase family protein [Candidatus Omnitrophota bacterium]
MNENIYNQAYQLRRKVAEKSLLSFAKLFTPHYLTQPPSKRHLELYDLALRMLSERGRRVALAAPRQFGKTTLFTNIYLPYCVCYGKEQFIVIVSHTASQAIQILDNLKRELTGNVGFQETFPEIFESEGAPKPPRWTQNCIVTRNGIQILALGYGQQIRGRKHGPYRPSLVILDDLEASENMFSVETKEKMKSWLNKSVLRVGTNQTNYLFLGNVLNSFSLLGEIIKEGKASGWDTTIRYQAIEQWPKHMHLWQVCWRIYTEQELYRGTSGPAGALQYYQDNKPSMDEGARTLWPEHWSLFQLMMEYFQNEIAFLSEMQNTPPDASDLALDVEGFHYWNDRFSSLEALLEFLSKDGQCFFCACDPAMGKDAVRGDNSAIVIVGYKDRVYYILEADICHRNPDRLITDILAFCERYKFRKFAIEANGFQELIRRRLQDRAFELGIRTEFV